MQGTSVPSVATVVKDLIAVRHKCVCFVGFFFKLIFDCSGAVLIMVRGLFVAELRALGMQPQ